MENASKQSVLSQILKQVRELIVAAGIALFALFFNSFVAQAVSIDQGPSMQPNLFRGDRVIIEKLSRNFRTPRRGDIVVALLPNEPISLIKRVIALPGERVQVRAGHVLIDNKPITEPWVVYWGGPDYPVTIIPANEIFILGDNRAQSRDSRMFGPVPLHEIEGSVLFVYWPLGHAGLAP
jgi:signal peptidase I